MINPLFLIDFYKVGHINQYPAGISQVWSNWTPRTSRVDDTDVVIHFGLNYFIKEYLQNKFQLGFFGRPLPEILTEYREVITATLGVAEPRTDHIEALHNLGYLPITIYSLPEGTGVPLNIPPLIITNNLPEFFWLPNYFETMLSAVLWKPCTSATTARRYRKVFLKYAREAGETDFGFIDWQGHDFSFRGMSGLEDAILSGMGHLTQFSGTDTIPAILAAKKYYGAALTCGGSVPATEHSVMSAGSQDGELETFRRLITEVYPSGIVSIVSDTWDLWKVLTEYVPALKSEILARDGKLVIRPDSGDPVKIICGDPAADYASRARLGTLTLLANELGVTNRLINKAAAIYGDSITVARADEILRLLVTKGLSPYNMVFGIGSYCVTPETPILCGDLIWRAAGTLKNGQEIIAFDETPKFEDGKKASRCYRMAQITHNKPSLKACLRIQTDIGDPVTASTDHPWLVWVKNRSGSNMRLDGITGPKARRYPRSAGLAWKRTCDLVPGDKIAFIGRPWAVDDTREGGWLSGMFEGEGSLSLSNGASIPSWKVNLSQNAGSVLDRVRVAIRTRGFAFYENKRRCAQIVLTGGWLELLRFLGSIRPERLINKFRSVLKSMPALKKDSTYTIATVTSVDDVGLKEVASITTSCGTFITAGYLSHNTYEYVTRDTYGWAMKATAVRKDGEVIPIFKKPVTDNGGKFSHKGLLAVYDVEGRGYMLLEETDEDHLNNCAYEKVFVDGQLLVDPTFDEIRKRARAGL